MAPSVPNTVPQEARPGRAAWAPVVRRPTKAARAVRDIPWLVVTLQAAGLWTSSRVIVLIFTYFAVLFSFGAHGAQTHLIGGHPHAVFSLQALLQSWYRWDALRYVHIATSGYAAPQDTAFFPLFPLEIRLFMLPLGNGHPLVAGMLAANLDALAAFIALGLLAYRELDLQAVPRVILVAAAYPLAFFTAAAYADVLFLAFTLFSLLSARRGSWNQAAAFAFLAGLTRPTAVVLVLPLLWEYCRRHDWWRGRLRERFGPADLRRLVLLGGAVPLAVALYAAYLWQRFGHPLLFMRVQSEYWHRVDMPLWRSLPRAIAEFAATPAGTYDQARLLVDLAPLTLFALLTVASIRRIPVAFTLYMLGTLYLCVATPMLDTQLNDPDIFVSSGRFLIAAFPIFLLLGSWMKQRPWLEMLLLGGGFALQAILAAFFLSGGWLV
jgi:hypothetical protein